MSIPEEKIYPRIGDTQTIYLKSVITNPNIRIGDYTMYNDFVDVPLLVVPSLFLPVPTIP